MKLLIAGLTIWSLVHFIPSLAQPLKQKLVKQMGANGYKVAFTVLILISLALIVFGWRSSVPATLYVLPAFSRPVLMLVILIAFILFAASHHQTRIKSFIRHPQLTALRCGQQHIYCSMAIPGHLSCLAGWVFGRYWKLFS